MFNSGYSDIGSYSSLAKLQRPGAISYDTSSKDPQMLRSRIFVGGLNTNTVSRDDVIQLFSSYGTILGVTLFKGYAFVQYSSVSEADLAVSALNYYHWHGSALEVKTVAKDQKGTTSTSLSGSSNGTFGKRPAQNDSTNGAKKGRPQSNFSMDAAFESRNEFHDFFICGECRFTTTNLEAFVAHRKTPCNMKAAGKSEEEPEEYHCRSCEAKFITCWELLEHLGVSHNLSVYNKDVALAGVLKVEEAE